MSGDTTIGTITLSTTPCHLTDSDDARAAPTSPPMSACEDEDGRPRYQVPRFQTMAPSRAARTTTRPALPCVGGGMIPVPTVAATLVEIRAPTTLNTAAIARATRGVRALVEIEVAIALAESWNPLVKSKASATTTITTTRAVMFMRQDSLTAMVSTAWATCSRASAASSKPSATSRSLTIVSAS
jgi:hypothetical protein